MHPDNQLIYRTQHPLPEWIRQTLGFLIVLLIASLLLLFMFLAINIWSWIWIFVALLTVLIGILHLAFLNHSEFWLRDGKLIVREMPFNLVPFRPIPRTSISHCGCEVDMFSSVQHPKASNCTVYICTQELEQIRIWVGSKGTAEEICTHINQHLLGRDFLMPDSKNDLVTWLSLSKPEEITASSNTTELTEWELAPEQWEALPTWLRADMPKGNIRSQKQKPSNKIHQNELVRELRDDLQIRFDELCILLQQNQFTPEMHSEFLYLLDQIDNVSLNQAT